VLCPNHCHPIHFNSQFAPQHSMLDPCGRIPTVDTNSVLVGRRMLNFNGVSVANTARATLWRCGGVYIPYLIALPRVQKSSPHYSFASSSLHCTSPKISVWPGQERDRDSLTAIGSIVVSTETSNPPMLLPRPADILGSADAFCSEEYTHVGQP
jgi:hypothetical protein